MSTANNKLEEVLQLMLKKDHFSSWMGLEIEEFRIGYCKLKFKIRGDMLNGFGIVHGGVIFSAADSAFAFACNSRGTLTLAIEANISFIKSAKEGGILVVEATEVNKGNRIGIYEVKVSTQTGELVSLFKGTGYQTNNQLE